MIKILPKTSIRKYSIKYISFSENNNKSYYKYLFSCSILTFITCIIYIIFILMTYFHKNEKDEISKFVYEIKGIELDKNYKIGNITRVSKLEIESGILNSNHTFDNVFLLMENTLRMLNRKCIAMHHYNFENSKRIVGLLMKDQFIILINPIIIGGSIQHSIVKYKGNILKRRQYIKVKFYYDLLFESKNLNFIYDGTDVFINEYFVNSTISNAFHKFKKSYFIKKRYVEWIEIFYNEYAACLETIIDEFYKKIIKN